MSKTLAELCRDVSELLGDYDTGTVTGVASASAFQDSGHQESDGYWTGGWLAFTAGPNAGLERRILAFSSGGFTTNPFPQEPGVGDAFELRRRPVHRREAIKLFLNAAIREMANEARVMKDSWTIDPSLAYDAEQYEYLVPDALETVHRVLFRDETLSTWVELPPEFWDTNRTGSVLIEPGVVPDGAKLRFLGTGPLSELVNESDVCPKPDYPVVAAARRLALRLAHEGGQDAQEYFRLWTALGQETESARRRLRETLPTNTRLVR